MKLFRIDLYAPTLGELRITPLWDDEETKDLLRDANGVYDSDFSDSYAETSNLGYHTIYMADYNDNTITATDENGNIIAESDNFSDFTISYNAVSELITNEEGFNCDNPSEEDEKEFSYCFGGVSMSDCKKILNAKVDGTGLEIVDDDFFEDLRNGKYNDCDIIRAYAKWLFKRSFGSCELEYKHAILNYGMNYKERLTYFIYLDDNEDFDINKVHFLDSYDWWDNGVSEATEGAFADVFMRHNILADFLEYDGRIIRRDASTLWIIPLEEGIIIDSDMEPVDIDL